MRKAQKRQSSSAWRCDAKRRVSSCHGCTIVDCVGTTPDATPCVFAARRHLSRTSVEKKKREEYSPAKKRRKVRFLRVLCPPPLFHPAPFTHRHGAGSLDILAGGSPVARKGGCETSVIASERCALALAGARRRRKGEHCHKNIPFPLP